MDFDVEVRLLSEQFSNDYPPVAYPELERKAKRPYTCLLIDTHQDYFICIPFRSHVSHNNAFHFKKSKRSARSRSGLDYTKTALISNPDYIDSTPAVIDKDEYNETMKNISKIIKDVTAYIDCYIKHQKGIDTLHPKEYARKYSYSTLPYFHDILRIE